MPSTSRAPAGGSAVGPIAWAVLFVRPALALAGQVLLAATLAVAGRDHPWRASADAWLATFAFAEVVNLWLLGRLARREGRRLRDLFHLGGRATLRGDLAWLVVAVVVASVFAVLPNVWLATWLWGDPQVGADLIFRPLPLPLAAALVVVFPIVHALTELPTYLGYVLPRLQRLTGQRWIPILVCASVLSAQHMFLPLLPDVRYLVWRLFMFLPFAVWVAFVVDRRPTVLPYLMAAHALLDLSLPVLVLAASLG